MYKCTIQSFRKKKLNWEKLRSLLIAIIIYKRAVGSLNIEQATTSEVEELDKKPPSKETKCTKKIVKVIVTFNLEWDENLKLNSRFKMHLGCTTEAMILDWREVNQRPRKRYYSNKKDVRIRKRYKGDQGLKRKCKEKTTSFCVLKCRENKTNAQINFIYCKIASWLLWALSMHWSTYCKTCAATK